MFICGGLGYASDCGCFVQKPDENVLDDALDFIYNYRIILGVQELLEEKQGMHYPDVDEDVVFAKEVYEKLLKSIGYSRLIFAEFRWAITSVIVMKECHEMYYFELNKSLRTTYMPMDPSLFSHKNWLCTTSYEDAKRAILKLYDKYRGRVDCSLEEEL